MKESSFSPRAEVAVRFSTTIGAYRVSRISASMPPGVGRGRKTRSCKEGLSDAEIYMRFHSRGGGDEDTDDDGGLSPPPTFYERGYDGHATLYIPHASRFHFFSTVSAGSRRGLRLRYAAERVRRMSTAIAAPVSDTPVRHLFD